MSDIVDMLDSSSANGKRHASILIFAGITLKCSLRVDQPQSRRWQRWEQWNSISTSTSTSRLAFQLQRQVRLSLSLGSFVCRRHRYVFLGRMPLNIFSMPFVSWPMSTVSMKSSRARRNSPMILVRLGEGRACEQNEDRRWGNVSVTQVQIDSLEKFVGIIEYLVQNVENADILIREYLFQSIIQTIGHTNNRVSVTVDRWTAAAHRTTTTTLLVKIRKSSQSALIRLFEYEQVKSEDIEEEIIPALCQLDRACDDFKNESILVGELFSFSFAVVRSVTHGLPWSSLTLAHDSSNCFRFHRFDHEIFCANHCSTIVVHCLSNAQGHLRRTNSFRSSSLLSFPLSRHAPRLLVILQQFFLRLPSINIS